MTPRKHSLMWSFLIQESTPLQPSSALRALIIEGKVYDMDYSFMREYNIKLGNISSNINQIARRVNSTGSIYEADINASGLFPS